MLSCKKDKVIYNPDDPCSQVSVFFSGIKPVNSFEYDDLGRVITVGYIYTDNTTSFTYYKDSIVQSGKDMFDLDIRLTYYLDANGRITKTSAFDYKYTYNADGYLVSFQTVNATYSLKYDEGDLIEISTSSPGTGWQKMNFEYYKEANQCLYEYNQPLHFGGVSNERSVYLIKLGFYGKMSTHLYKVRSINGTPGDVIAYKKDGKERISEIDGRNRVQYTCD